VDTIVCGVHDSASARRAASFAALLSESVGAELVLAHAVPFVLGRTGAELAAPAVDIDALLDAGESAINRIRRDCALPDTVTHHVTVGSARGHLLNLATQDRTRLLVIGAHGRPRVPGMIGRIGSFVTKAGCPVVIVMPHHTIRLLDTIVCGIDHTETSVAAAHVAGRLGVDLEARLVFAHAVPAESHRAVQHASKDGVDPHFADRSVRADLRLVTGAAEHALSVLAEDEGAALLVVGSRGRGAVASAIFGSVSAQLSSLAPCPTMIVPRRPDA
jgi:nucleotide-binding universal stress UspA family protein